MENISNLFLIIGGIGMFLYGMNIMSEGLQKLAGNKLSDLLKTLTKTIYSSILVGALVTAVIQSSAATTVTVVGFVNAGIMTLKQAVGVIMGANIGTTITAWIVSLSGLGDVVAFLNPEFTAPIIFGVSALIYTFARKEKVRNASHIFVGLGLLFIGLSFISNGSAPYSQSKIFYDIFDILGKNPILAIIAGAIVTVILSSSSASLSILQTLSLTATVSKSAACFIILGMNIGTCVTTLLSSVKSGRNGKRAALIHLLFNVIGSVIFSVLVLITFPFTNNYLQTQINIFEISIFHSFFNIANTLILMNFSNQLVAISMKLIKTDGEEEEILNLPEKTAEVLDERLLTQPSIAIDTVKSEVVFFAKFTLKNLRRATNLILGKRDADLIQKVVTHEMQIDKTTYILMNYLSRINRLSLTDEQTEKVEELMTICSNVERIGDHAENLSEKATQLIDMEVDFSDEGKSELKNVIDLTLTCVENGIVCIDTGDLSAVQNVRESESRVDDLQKEYTENHLHRMGDGKCNTISGMIFLDVINNLERVTDHANNLADCAEARNGRVKT